MRPPSFRVRTLMVMVAVVALLVWGANMGLQSYEYYARARMHADQEAYWRAESSSEAAAKTAAYHARLTAKCRRAMWCPWMDVEPDP